MINGDQKHTTWRKSSYSNGQSSCVEVSDHVPGTVPVRDSKHPDGPALAVPVPVWAAFVTAVRAGRLRSG
ncbi:DUF397 domain-containing protein [Streptomyces gamaensis]|uniref:DUF397 domain-containing protein n=1 Tax=Streptomyces gamaensis TaxID=1763542 RepID=A0ABW0YY02_9ACTN